MSASSANPKTPPTTPPAMAPTLDLPFPPEEFVPSPEPEPEPEEEEEVSGSEEPSPPVAEPADEEE
jgi:hypothetical protein